LQSGSPDAERTAGKRRSLSVRLAALALALVPALLVLEIGLRVFRVPFIYFAMYETPLQRGAVEPHPDLQYVNRPGYAGTFKTGEFRTGIRINSKGLRDREYPYEKPAGTKRLLALGDSMVYGWGVEAEQAATEVLERRLSGVEVINAGCPGWGTRHHLRFLQDEGIRYQPDVVLLFFCTNDPEDNGRQIKFVDGQVAAPEAPEGTAGRVKRWVTRHFATYTLLARGKAELGRIIGRGQAPELDTDALWGAEAAYLEGVQAFCRKRGVRLALVYIPDETAEHLAWAPRVRAFCQENGLALLDLSGAHEEAARTGPVMFRLDPHWTPHGHEAVASAIQDFLKERNWP